MSDGLKKTLWWIALLAVLYLVATDPDRLTGLIDGVVDFIGRLLENGRRIIDNLTT